MSSSDWLIIYHGPNCVDGWCAAWLAERWLTYESDYEIGRIDRHPAFYGQNPPDVEGKNVLIVDFSYPRDVLEEMHKKAAWLQVLDHHKTAAENLEGLDYAIFDMGRSGAKLVFDEFCHQFENSPYATEIKIIVDYVQDRDLWKNELPYTDEVHAVLSLRPFEFQAWEAFMWTGVLSAENLSFGKGVIESRQKYIDKTSSGAVKMTFDTPEGTPAKCWVVNAPYWSVSDMLNELSARAFADGSMPDFCLSWFYRDAKVPVLVSVRSTPRPDGTQFDCSKFAEMYGGGGHVGAAGFSLPSPDMFLRR